MNNRRPKNLNLLTIRFPIPAIVSILHRISGVILFVLTPILIAMLGYSLRSEENFNYLHDMFITPTTKIIILLSLSAFFFHFIAGIRHLLLDLNLGVKLRSGRRASYLTIILTIIATIIAGYYIW